MSLILDGPYEVIPVPTQRGFNTAFCRRQTGRWSPTNGWTFDQEFNSLSLAQMQAIATVYGNAGIEYSLTFENGIARMTTTDTTGNITIDVWEIVANQVTVSWLKNPLLLAQLYVVAAAYIASVNPAQSTNQDVLDRNVTRFVGKMSTGIQNGTSALNTILPAEGDEASTTVDGVFSSKNFFDGNFTFASIDPSVYLPIFRAYQRAAAGQDVFFSDEYSLRHTTNASNRGYYNVADVNVNCVYTQAQLYSEIQDNGYWVFAAPPEIIGALDTIFASLGDPTANYTQGALKGGSSRVTAANNRVNITTEYKIENIAAPDEYNLAT